MSRRSEKPEDLDSLREKIIGLGERSVRKTYYPELQERLRELEEKIRERDREMADRKRAEAAVRTSRRQLQSIIDNSNAVIYLKDLEGRFILINRRFEDLFHVTKESVVGKTDHDIFPKEQADAFRAFDKHVISTGTTQQAEEVAPQDDGLHTYISVKTPLYDGTGKIYAICGISTDITERKIAEEERLSERKKAEELLREKTVYLDNILHSSTLAVIAMDIDLRIKYYNHVAAKFFGYPTEEVIGKTLRDLHFGGTIDLTCLEKAIDSAQRGNEYICISFRKDPDGELFYESRYNGIRNNKNELVGLVIMTADVTKRTSDENRLRKYAETQRILLQEVNHRVKNNLMVIISMLHKEADRAGQSGRASYIPFLEELHGRIEGLLTVHSMLSSVNWQPLKLDALCDQIVRGVLKSSAKAVVLSVSPSGLMVDSNQSHNLTLVLNELATNSLKYAVSVAARPCVDINISERDGKICIIFRDNGPGFPEAIISGNLQGTGIGFDLVTGIVRKSIRGTMSFWNDNGAVSEICFEKMSE